MCKFKGIRSVVGFRREHVQPSASPQAHRPGTRVTVPSVLVPHSDDDREGYSSLGELVTHDCMHWILSSPNPTSSALSLRSRLLQGDEGGQHRGAHEG